jgi:hypothetical protein
VKTTGNTLIWDKTNMYFNFPEGIKFETTHVGKQILRNNNLMQVEQGEFGMI